MRGIATGMTRGERDRVAVVEIGCLERSNLGSVAHGIDVKTSGWKSPSLVIVSAAKDLALATEPFGLSARSFAGLRTTGI
jgi:hypothetical protein